jgi:hypothetical protein
LNKVITGKEDGTKIERQGAHIKPGGKARALVVFDSKRFPE